MGVPILNLSSTTQLRMMRLGELTVGRAAADDVSFLLLFHNFQDSLEGCHVAGDLQHPFLLKPELLFRLSEEKLKRAVAQILRRDNKPLQLFSDAYGDEPLRDNAVVCGGRDIREGQRLLQKLIYALTVTVGGGLWCCREPLPLLEDLSEPDYIADFIRLLRI